MSFAHDLKVELCEKRPVGRRQQQALLHGLLLFGKGFSMGGISLSTEHEQVAGLYDQLLEELTGVSPTLTVQGRSGGTPVYLLTVDEPGQRMQVLKAFGLSGFEEHLSLGQRDKSGPEDGWFLRGAFLAGGVVTDPMKSYHLEISTPDALLADGLAQLLGRLLSSPKISRLRSSYRVYYKESEQIEDFLTFIGSKAALEIMNVKILKDVRNKVNRVTNCETANIDKTCAAAQQQVADIRQILDRRGESFLPEDLRELAYFRLENPDLSLRELGEELGLSRSGVNHRLQRISRMARELEEGQAQSEPSPAGERR